MNWISPQLAKRVRKVARETQSHYRLSDWLWALNLEARNEPRQLQKTAAILREMKLSLTLPCDD